MAGESVGAACFDTLVVGGGMVGSALALGLSRQGWNTGLVEGARVQDLLARERPPVIPMTSSPGSAPSPWPVSSCWIVSGPGAMSRPAGIAAIAA